MNLLNCWEYLKCGIENQCPAHPNQGRNCFAVPGTLCKGQQQGSFREKIDRCRECDFYKSVMFAE